MKQNVRKLFWCTLVLSTGVTLSGCSMMPNSWNETLSGFNPFQQRAAEAPVEAAPVVVPAASIRVDAKPPTFPKVQAKALPNTTEGLEVNVGSNKQCTTFCALPVRKPRAK